MLSYYTLAFMNDNMSIARELIEKFYRLMNKFKELENMPYEFSTGETMYPSEIHTIEAIGKNSGINITELAKKLCITKGAVSQMITKLKNRGFINKVRSVDNDKEVLLILTNKGEKAFDGHEKFHNAMNVDLTDYLSDIKKEQIDWLKTAFDKVEFYIDQYRP